MKESPVNKAQSSPEVNSVASTKEMRLPNLSTLAMHESQREEDTEVFAELVSLLSPVNVLQSNWFTYPYPLTSYDNSLQSESEPLTPTSKLWKDNLLDPNQLIKDWDHIDYPKYVKEFFGAAKKSGFDSLAHVVLVQKRYDINGEYPEMCQSTLGINKCYHGMHISVYS